ncbi:hypothetical protein MPH_06262 [Macrophomina phaseolina MS6]|uniref:Uncharacterized protein n=1 Tax=Macrophomina phaseolina (strain MS6) TaxID=1126212 RepID=K2R2K1_MACPH|nr:hypothetical protein MPH_06262 [Macrophomina phaseolina MS6]
MIGAKEHLTKSNASIITRSSPPSQPVELAAGEVELGQHLNGNVAPASITLPPSRPSTSCSVSSLGSADNAFVSHAQWDSIHHAGGDVSPLDRSLNNSPAPGSFRKHHGLPANRSLVFDQHAHQYFDHAENNADGGANGPVALSEGDLSWRQEFFSNQAMEPGSWHEENQRRRSLAAEQRLDMALESLRRNSIPASVATGQTFGSFAHPYGGYEDEESLDEHPFEIRPEYLPLPDDATDGTADDELSISLATSADFDQRYSTGETSQMTAEFGRGEECDDQKLAQSSSSLHQSPLEKSAHGDEELHADQTESDTEVDKATTVGNFDDVGIPEGDAAVSDNVSEIHVTTAASASGGLDDNAPLRDSGPGNNGAALDSEAQDKQSSIEQIISSDGPTDESVEQPKSDTKAVDSLSPAPEEQKINIDVDSEPAVANDTVPVSITTDPESESEAEEITADEAPEQPIQSAEDAQEEAMCQVPEDAALSHSPIEITKIDVPSETNQVEEELNSIKEPEPIDQESHHAFGDLTATAAAAVVIQDDESSHSQPEENSAGLESSAKIIEDASLVADQETKSINATAFPAAEASVVIEKEETSMHSEEGASQHASMHAILSMSSSPQSSARYPASSEAAESVSLKDMLQESRLMEPSRDDVASRNGQGEADLVLLSSLSRDEKSQNGKEAQPRRNRGMPEPTNDDDGWAIPGREQQEPQSQLPTRQRRKSLPMLFKDMKESRKEKKSLLPVKKEAKESKLALPSKKDHKPVLATAAMRESRIPTAPLSASMAEGPKSPFSPGKKGRNVLQRNSSTSRLLDQSLPSPVKDKERRKRGSLLGAVFGRSSTPGPDFDKERERQMEKLNKEREKQKEPKPKKKDSKSKLVIPPRRYSLAGPLGGHHDHIASFAAPRVPTPKRVQEISALSHFEGPSKTQERPRSGNSSLDSQPREERPTSAADLAAAVAAAVDANHNEIKSRVRRPGVIPEPGPEWEEWEQKARELEGNRTKVNGSPASGISIPAVLHGPGTPTQAKLYPHDPDSYPFYQFAPPALPPHLQAPPRPFYYGNPPRSATFNESPAANQFSSGYGSLQRRYSEHFSAASARGLPPFPPHLYGLRDGDYPAHPLRQTSQPQLRPHSNAGPSSPIAPGSAPHGKSPEQEAIEMAGASASPIASNAATVDSYEQDSTFVPPPIPLPGETMEQFLEKQRIWYEHHAQAANRRDSGYSPQYGYAAQQGMPFPPQDLPPHLAQGFYPYPPQWYWAQGYPPPPPQAYAHLFPPASHSPEDYYHQTLREQQQQERANSDTDSPRDKSPIPAPYGFPGPFPPAPPRSAYAHTPAAPGPYGYPRQEMRWRDLTSEGPAQGQQISHKRIDSGAYAGQASPTYAPGAGSMSAHQQGPNTGRDVDDEKAQHPKTSDAKSSASSRDVAGKQNAELARRQTVSGGVRNSNSKLETVMEPVELADTDVGRRTSSGLPEMHAASYPGMEWMPEGYVEE